MAFDTTADPSRKIKDSDESRVSGLDKQRESDAEHVEAAKRKKT